MSKKISDLDAKPATLDAKPTTPDAEPTTAEDNSYQVGYGKPPLHSRWQPGQSGNADGRTNGSLNRKTLGDMLAEELAVLVPVKGSDGKKKVCKLRAYFKTLINDALTGGARDKKILLEAMLRLVEPQALAADGVDGEAVPGGADALERHVERAIRRKKLEDDTPKRDDEDGEDSP